MVLVKKHQHGAQEELQLSQSGVVFRGRCTEVKVRQARLKHSQLFIKEIVSGLAYRLIVPTNTLLIILYIYKRDFLRRLGLLGGGRFCWRGKFFTL